MRGSQGLDAILADASCSLLGMGSRMWTLSRWNDGVSLRGVWNLEMQVLLSIVRAHASFYRRKVCPLSK